MDPDFDVEAHAGLDGEEAVRSGHFYPHGLRLTFKVSSIDDLERNFLKSDTTFVSIPDIEFEIPPGLSQFTDIKSFLLQVRDNLQSVGGTGPAYEAVLRHLHDMIQGSKQFTLFMDDPLGRVWVESKATDKKGVLEAEKYPRSILQCLEFGLPPPEPPANRPSHDDPINNLVEYISRARSIVVLTGAGVSVESGIPAFRTPNAVDNIWDKFDPNSHHITAFKESLKAREEYWQMKTEFRSLVEKAQPNAAHRLVAYLERIGRLRRLITQNIDSMHQRAGLDTSNIIELHGSERNASCVGCGAEADRQGLHLEILAGRVRAPTCPLCDAPIKISTISFGEAIPRKDLDGSFDSVRKCDLLLIMGTALVVQPANTLPLIAINKGVPVVLLNIGETAVDRLVDLHIAEPCGAVCGKALARLRSDPEVTKHERKVDNRPYYWSLLSAKRR